MTEEATELVFCEMKTVEEEAARPYINSHMHVFELKHDGTAGIIAVDHRPEAERNVIIHGRGIRKSGVRQDYTEVFTELIPTAEKFRENINNAGIECIEMQTIGEIVHITAEGIESIHCIESRCNRKNDREAYALKYPATYFIFDILSFNGEDLRGKPFIERRKFLESLKPYLEGCTNFEIVDQCTTMEEKQALFDRVLEGKNIEGLVVKAIDSPFPDDTLKFKYKETQDVFWEGEYNEGKNARAGKIGSLICYQYINGKKMHVASVGGGITHERMDELMRMVQNGEVSKENPKVLVVQAHRMYKSGSMQYPNFIAWRSDKSPEQCVRTIEEIVCTTRQKKAPKPKAEKTEKPKKEKPTFTANIDQWL